MIARQLVARLLLRELGFEQTDPLEIGDSRTNAAPIQSRRSVKSPADTLRAMAERLGSQIEQKTAPMSQAWTAKRGREHAARVHEGNNLRRLQTALNALADAWDAGNVPDDLQNLRTRKEILPMVETRGGSNGYCDYHELHGEFRDNSERAKLLRSFCGIEMSPEQEKRAKVDRLLHELRLNPHEGFFPTPRSVIDLMIEKVRDKLSAPDVRVLEPSAGIGSIIDAVEEIVPHACIHAVEIAQRCRDVLEAKGFKDWTCFANVFDPRVRLLHGAYDFLDTCGKDYYDVILMNPPFESRQDEAHVCHAFGQLAVGGRLVAIVSAGAILNQRSRAFQDWLASLGAMWESLPEGAFNSADSFRRTGVRCYMIVIDKE